MYGDMVAEPEIDPNRLRIDGGDAADDVVVSASIETDATRVEVRGGVATRTVEIPHDGLSAVDYDRGLNYDLVLTADGTTYRLTNVTASREEIESIADAIRQARRERAGSVTDGGSPDAGAGRSGDAAAVGGTPDGTGDSDGSGSAADPDGTTAADELRKWARLRDDGVITEAEFEQKKAELLGD